MTRFPKICFFILFKCKVAWFKDIVATNLGWTLLCFSLTCWTCLSNRSWELTRRLNDCKLFIVITYYCYDLFIFCFIFIIIIIHIILLILFYYYNQIILTLSYSTILNNYDFDSLSKVSCFFFSSFFRVNYEWTDDGWEEGCWFLAQITRFSLPESLATIYTGFIYYGSSVA